MDPIENISLKEELQAARKDALEAKKKAIREKIARIIGEHDKAKGTVRRLEQDLDKARASVKKQEDLLSALEAEDWSRLPEEKIRVDAGEVPPQVSKT